MAERDKSFFGFVLESLLEGREHSSIQPIFLN